MQIKECILRKRDNENTVCRLLLDLAKVFDTVDQNVLLQKLEHCGIRGLLFKLLKSYLHSRK